MKSESLLGRGAYTPARAARLLRLESAAVGSGDVRRWAFGYKRRGQSYPGAIALDSFSKRFGALSFLELIELAYISGMLRSGATWPKVREAMRVAGALFPHEEHPFAHRDWFADPGGIYTRLGREHGNNDLVEMVGAAQYAMEGLLRVYLRQIRFNPETGLADIWYPLGDQRPVLIDPKRSFGQPIVAGGVRTDILASHVRAGDSHRDVAAWFRISESEVEAAVELEARLTEGEG